MNTAVTTDANSAMLLAEIHANPDDDTARLVWADAVQEAGDEARAELVRVQVELTGMSSDLPENCTSRWAYLCNRERDLLAANAERWRQGPKCGACAGYIHKGKVPDDPNVRKTTWSKCRACAGTGDAGGLLEREQWQAESGTAVRVRVVQLVTYRRGLKLVHCRLEEVCELAQCELCSGSGIAFQLDASGEEVRVRCPSCDGGRAQLWQPTAWAKRVVAAHPDVEGFWIEDREPAIGSFKSKELPYWFRQPNLEWATGLRLPGGVQHLYAFLWDCIAGGTVYEKQWKHFDTVDLARLWLARGAAAWVRSHLSNLSDLKAVAT